MLSEATKKKLMKSAVTGTVLAVAGYVAYGGGTAPVFGMNIPAAIPLFVSGAASSVISDLVHEQINAHLTTATAKLGDISALALGAGIAGVASAGIMKIGIGVPNENLLAAAGLGAASYLAADFIEAKLFENTTSSLIF